MKQLKVRQQWARSTLAVFAVFVLFGFVFSSCKKCDDKEAGSKGTTGGESRITPDKSKVVHVPPENIISKGKELIAKSKEIMAMNDKLIAKAEAVNGIAVSPEVSEMRNNAVKASVDMQKASNDSFKNMIEWAEHVINGGTKSELERFKSEYENNVAVNTSKQMELGQRLGLEIKKIESNFSSLPVELTNAWNELNKAQGEVNGVLVGHLGILVGFGMVTLEFIDQLP
jgi:hypothetical protein